MNGKVLSTGLSGLDELLGGGFHSGSLNVIAARPGMGKTGLLAQIANYLAGSGKTVAFFTKEESKTQTVKRIKALSQKDSLYPTLIIDDMPFMTARYICEKVKGMECVDAVFVDSIQLLKSSNTKKEFFLEKCLKKFKLLADTLQIPVIIASRLSRPTVMDDFSTCPELKVLKHQADTMIFPRYTLETDLLELVVYKAHRGKIGFVPVRWNMQKAIFEDSGAPKDAHTL